MSTCNNNSHMTDVRTIHNVYTWLHCLTGLCPSHITHTAQDDRSQVLDFMFTEPAESIHSLHYVALRSNQMLLSHLYSHLPNISYLQAIPPAPPTVCTPHCNIKPVPSVTSCL